MNLIDCNELRVLPKTYGGATGAKIAVEYNNKVYMLKRQQLLRGRNMRNVEISYANDCVSEYIGSHVYYLLGFPVHDTVLGTYTGRMCVLCSDDAYPNKIIEFREIRNSIMDENNHQPSSGMSTDLDDIMYVIRNARFIDRELSMQWFWDMFVVDSIIGNCDRNNGNWGYTINGLSYDLYEVYDCGGCLNNKQSDEQLSSMSDAKFEQMAVKYAFNFVKNEHHVNPFKYMESSMNSYLQSAVDRVCQLETQELYWLVTSVSPIISDARIEYYMRVMSRRLEELQKFRTKKASIGGLFSKAEG